MQRETVLRVNKMADVLASRFSLCNRCLMRQFANSKARITVKKHDGACYLCDDIFSKISSIADSIAQKVEGFEFRTFLIGTRVPKRMLAKEEEIWDHNGLEYAESIKTEMNRELGKLVEKRLKKTVDYREPDMTLLIDLADSSVSVQVAPIYLYGHYLKFSRAISQTKWPCSCNGKGCQKCNNLGKMYISVEDLIAKEALEETGATGTKFHGAGREDINARMLGNGRAFIIELLEPRKRKISIRGLESRINSANKTLVKIRSLSFCKKAHVELLKNARLEKVYKARAVADEKINLDKLALLSSLNSVAQRTPTRVLHRRADKERVRGIRKITWRVLGPKELEFVISAEAGTYIKELISGDNGRTRPSVAELLNTNIICSELDVIKINDSFLNELISG